MEMQELEVWSKKQQMSSEKDIDRKDGISPTKFKE